MTDDIDIISITMQPAPIAMTIDDSADTKEWESSKKTFRHRPQKKVP
jgi:hypothetical protein